MKTRALAMMGVLLLAGLVTFSYPIAVEVRTNEGWYVLGGYNFDLVAGKNTDVGDIDISFDGSSITITLTTHGDWLLAETHARATCRRYF
ncbi:MAG: hypothetical protein V1915_00025 [Candidatus Bathyarchaeota archaeon]